MQDQGAVDYEVFKRRIHRKTGLNLDSYKQEQMERRLRSFMERVGAGSFQEYYRMLDQDEALMRQFMDRVTINVSEFFRNPDQFKVFREKVLPELTSRSREIKVWSAGCSNGQEPYTLAMCLQDAGVRKPNSIIATDLDVKALEFAKAGVYSSADAKNVDPEKRRKWFAVTGDKLAVNGQLKEMIEFRKLDLLNDAYPSGVDLIVCRNVVIYFTELAKARLYRNFYLALKPGGYLFVGGTERVCGYSEIGYANPFPFFYRRPSST